MKTAKDILLENIPKDCWWDEMENLTNTPVEYVTKAMESFAAQSVREDRESRVDPLDIARFWIKVEQTEYCWNWTASVDNHGYGKFRFKDEILAHRISWIMMYGPIPEGQGVLHRCDNPKCVNPNHLFIGTHEDNMKDKMLKGRGRHQGRTSKYLGVGFRNDSGNWRSYIAIKGIRKHIGTFDTEIEAAQYRDQYVIDNKLNLPLNFPLPLPSPPTNKG